MNMAVQHGDVAETHYPFGVLCKCAEVQTVDQAHGAVAPAGAKHGAHLWVIEQLLQQCGSGGVVSGKLVVGVEQVFGQCHFKPPAFKQFDGWVEFVG